MQTFKATPNTITLKINNIKFTYKALTAKSASVINFNNFIKFNNQTYYLA